jgi:outer membrane biosynthesis protein TonB
MLAPTKPSTPAPLLKPVNLPPRKPEEEKPGVKSPGENKGLKEGTDLKGSLEKPKPVPDEGLKQQPETKLAMLKPPPSPKTVPVPLPEPPQPETPPAKPELSLQQPPPAPASPPSPPGGTGSAGSASEREIAARKSKMNTIGVTRLGIAAFNVAESPFGAYDKVIVRAVQSRWYALIEKNGLYERGGEVTIHFQLLADGSVTNAEVKSTSAGEILALFCQKAIVESAPFAPWPEQLRAYLGNDPRDIDFTFYY